MNRVSAAICLILVTIAAVEFGLLGASAAGITGGSGHDLPPVGERLGVIPTDTPTVPPNPSPTPMTPVINPSPPQLSPPSVVSGITIIADRLAIQCDGSQTSHVRVRILDVNGNPAPDGINVYFEPYNGNAEPYFAQTVDGYAETDVRFYGDIFPYGPNLIVRADLLQAGIRILCFPRSDECPLSPPALSPPCGPTSTPTPCFDSPPSSPPCIPPTPISPPDECAVSPPSVSPPCEPTPTIPPDGCPLSPPSVSPPCEPTPVSPPALGPFDLEIDCDVATSGIQSACSAMPDSQTQAAVVVSNRGSETTEIFTFNFDMHGSDTTRLNPPEIEGGNLDDNPDFNQAVLGAAGWACVPPEPVANTGGDGPGKSRSFISCYSVLSDQPSLAPGESAALALVNFDVPSSAQPGSVELRLSNALVSGPSFEALGYCDPGFEPQFRVCNGAVVTIASNTPPQIDIAFDCDLAQAGEQTQCSTARGSAIDVGVVLRNHNGFPVSLAAFNFFAVNDSIARLFPPLLGDGNLNANPDFNQAAVTGAGWACTPPPPTPDWVPGGPDTSSLLSCFTGLIDGPTIPDGSTIMLATVRYNVPSDAPLGPANLSFQDAAAFDSTFSEIGSCNPVVTTPMNCETASIDITAPATPAATQTVTPVRTSTRPPRTATVVATRTPLPHRCADVSGNGRVNLADIHEIAKAASQHQYRARYDINRDGHLTHADVIAAAKQFGRRC